jgi:hypothetical protein
MAVILRISASTEAGGKACSNTLVIVSVVSVMSSSHLGPNNGFAPPARGSRIYFTRKVTGV